MFGISTCKGTWILLIWHIGMMQNVASDIYSYRCQNGKYINKAFFCDGGNDCNDMSDENSVGCYRNRCGRNYWGCDGTVCKDISVRCNTKTDCIDGSDESDCGDENNINDCTWQNEKYLCDDNLKCLDFNNTCNGYCNCFDCSDEKEGCLNTTEMDEYVKKRPSYVCFKTPNGPHCCSEFDSVCHECSPNHQCDQKCVRFRQESKCLCDENYIGVPNTNNTKCLNNELKMNTLIYATENSIRILELHSNKSYTIKDGIVATSLTAAHGHVYYATFQNGTGRIFKTSNYSNTTHEIISSDSKIISLAIDWITNRTYYSTNASKIAACSEDGICKELKSCKAHSIGLAPRFGLLFWVETKDDQLSTTQYIMKSSMDGSDETLLTTFDKISWPVAISIDESSETIYFWTRFTELSLISFTGNRKKVIEPTVDSPFDQAVFTTFERKVYFASHESNQIHVGDIASKLFRAVVIQSNPNNSSLITHLYAYNPKLQRTKIADPCVNSCSGGLCLLRPSSIRKTLNYTCFYEVHFNVKSEQANEFRIVGQFLVAMLLLLLILIAVWLIFRLKRTFRRNDRPTEVNVPLQPRANNELLKNLAECSKSCETQYKKNMDCSTSHFKDANYLE